MRDYPIMILSKPNKPDAANPAIALCLTIEDQRRRVADLGRLAVAVISLSAGWRRNLFRWAQPRRLNRKLKAELARWPELKA
jgi:hypothetical protein